MPEREDTRPIKVEVRNLTKRFGDLLVLDDMSFNIRKGEFVCVVGPTGCGKTTFLNCLTRIHMPSEGDLYIDGVPADPRKHNISFVFQEPSALPWLTVEDNLAYGLKIKRIPKAEIDRRVNQILDLMGLQEFRKAYPGELCRLDDRGNKIGASNIADPDVVRQYLKLCHPDSLAIGIGNAHGFYNGPVDIRVEVLEECRKFTDIPFVLHGCTGMDEELVKRSIDSGVAKINFGTQVRCQYVNYLKEGLAEGKDQGHAWKLSQYAELRLREDIKDIIRLAGSKEKA